MDIHLEDLRREYRLAGLDKSSLDKDPIVQFEAWLKQAIESGVADPTAMTLATVGANLIPSQRIVLLKHLDQRGYVFFTNYSSQKAKEIDHNQNVCLHFPWHALERQVKVVGRAERISNRESLAYFLTRPRDSQLAAWASRQSQPINSRQLLLSQFEAIKSKFVQGDIPLPDFWGGYRVVPTVVEFWQGRENRLHDRFEYQRREDEWQISRLSP